MGFVVDFFVPSFLLIRVGLEGGGLLISYGGRDF